MNKLKELQENNFVNSKENQVDRGLHSDEKSKTGVDKPRWMQQIGNEIMMLTDKSGRILPFFLWRLLDHAWRQKNVENLQSALDLIRYWSSKKTLDFFSQVV